jgi:uncharacterized membrane protein YfcA
MPAAALIGFGLLAGAYGVTVGVGGGFVMTPLLLLVYGLAPTEAVGTTLAIVTLNTSSGLVAYARQRRIDYRLGFRIMLGGIPGAIVGAIVLGRLTQNAFEAVAGTLLLLLALNLAIRPALRSGAHQAAVAETHVRSSRFESLTMPVVGFGAGMIAGLLGLGGGVLLVPAMVYLLHRPTHIATATSLFSFLPYVVIALALRWSQGDILIVEAIFGGIGVIIGAQVGARTSQYLSATFIMRLLALAITVPAVQLLVRAFT